MKMNDFRLSVINDHTSPAPNHSLKPFAHHVVPSIIAEITRFTFSMLSMPNKKLTEANIAPVRYLEDPAAEKNELFGVTAATVAGAGSVDGVNVV